MMGLVSTHISGCDFPLTNKSTYMATSDPDKKHKVSNVKDNNCFHQMDTDSDTQPSLLRSIIAGSSAGAVEIGNSTTELLSILRLTHFHSHYIPCRMSAISSSYKSLSAALTSV